MSKATVINQAVNTLHVDYDFQKIFVFNNRFKEDTFLNASGGPLDFAGGILVGRVTASGKLVPLVSGAVDGSEIPVGILKTEIVQLGAGLDQLVNICIAGDVVRDKVILDGGDTLDSVVDGRPLKDRINADTMGIKLVDNFELTDVDNA